MEKITVQIRCGNAAFEEFPEEEIVRILRTLADRIELKGLDEPPYIQSLLDINGNVTGQINVE